MSILHPHAKTGPKDVFMHLLGIIWLYVSVITFGTLLFQYINIFFPDPLNYESARWAQSALRWPLSILVVVFPFYLWLTSFLQKDLEKHPEKRELKTRKWLLYFTLFVTTIIIVVDLITLIFRFLSGELTVRFALKVLVVLLLAAAVFVYYIWNLRSDTPASKHPTMKWFVRGVVAVAGISIIAGFFLAGSPQAERLRQNDDRRIADLQHLQYSIVDYWQIKGALPETLDELRDDIRGFSPPVDPVTGESYEYRVIDASSFELCATFQTTSGEGRGAPTRVAPPRPTFSDSFGDTWEHEAERTCFTRTIDPDRYPPRERPPLP